MVKKQSAVDALQRQEGAQLHKWAKFFPNMEMFEIVKAKALEDRQRLRVLVQAILHGEVKMNGWHGIVLSVEGLW